MKNLILCAIVFCKLLNINAQAPIDTFPLLQNYGEDPDFRIIMQDMEEWIQANPGDPNHNLNPYYKAKYFMMPRIDQNGSMKGYAKTLSDYILQYIPECEGSFIASDWYSIGPDRDAPNTQFLGLLQSVWVNPADENHILVGNSGGGIWESKSAYTDPEWHFITGNPGFPGMGIQKIAVNPSNINEIYAATKMYSVLVYERSYGVGAIYSNDGGITWSVDDKLLEFIEDPSTNIFEDLPIFLPFTYNLTYLPTTSPGVYDLYLPFFNYMLKKNFATGEWVPVAGLTLGIDASYQDIQSVPDDPSFLFATLTGISDVGGNKSNVKYSTNGGISWSLLTEQIADRVLISVPTAEEMFVMYNYDDYLGLGPVNQLLVYDITGSMPVLVNTITTNIKFEGEMSVSPTNTDIIYVSDTQDALYKSINGGLTFDRISYNNDENTPDKSNASTTHTDIRDLLFYKPTTDITGDNPGNLLTGDHDIIFIANDGGLSKTTEGGGVSKLTGWTNMNRTGLNINNSLGFGSSEIDKNRIITTANDGNGFIRRDIGWQIGPNGDQGESAVSNSDPNKSIGGITNGSRQFNSITVGASGFAPNINMPTVPKFNTSAPNPSKKVVEYHEITDDVWTGTSDVYSIENTFPINASGYYDWDQISFTWFESSPADKSLAITQPITALEFVPNPSNPNLNFIYYGVQWSSAYPADINAATDHKMIRFNPNALAGDQWKNITPYNDGNVYPFADGSHWSAFNESYVFDIAADPSNPLEIWAGFTKGYYDDSPINWRVMYSPDGGDTWYDRSNGLPDFPINSLVYWKGTDDILFAGTDVGVYVWNKTEGTTTGEGVWECYMNGLPKVFVTDMEINYCTQSLRITTYGHSMWETTLPSVGITSYQAIQINEDQTWSQDFDTYTNVIVNSGAALTIENCEVRFPKGASLIIQPGGKVIVDGATLTNRCDFWQGVDVRGADPTVAHPDLVDIYTGLYPEDGDDHGVLYLKNGATIKNAVIGATTISGYFFRGGIIIASEANFINNQTAVTFNPFDYGFADVDDDNISEFYNCEFTIDDEYLGEDFDYHVIMLDVDGIDFHGCRFVDNRSGAPLSGTEGIFSEDATFRVKNVPCPPGGGGCPDPLPIESSFSKFFRGIEVSNTHFLPREVEINSVNFINNKRGILLSSVENSLIINNTFEVPDNISTHNYGLYLESCKNYHVENNIFTNYGLIATGPPFKTGIYVANNSNANTLIYRNVFENLEAGIICQGNNSHLQIKCNAFESMIYHYNIFVTSGELGNQGRCLGAPAGWDLRSQAPAGNTFSHDCSNIEGDFRVAITTPAIPPFEYRYHTGDPAYRPNENCYTSSIITLKECTLIGYDQNGNPSCPSTLPEESEGGSGGEMMMSMASSTNEVIVKELLKVDGGNTEGLISEIINSTSETELYDSLMKVGSYLSEGVLSTLVSTSDILTTPSLLDVLSENSPINVEVAAMLELSNYDVPAPVIESLADTISVNGDGEIIPIESDLAILMEEIELLESERSKYLEEAIETYLIENEPDSALVAASGENSRSLKWQTEIYFTIGDYNAATTTLDNIIIESEEDADFIKLYSIIIGIHSDNRTMREINADEELILRLIGGKYTTSGVKALNILKYALNEDHEEIFDEFDDFYFRVIEPIVEESNKTFFIYPNPSDNIVYIELKGELANNENVLNIYDVTGTKILTETLRTDFNISWLDVQKFTQGIYFLEIISFDANGNQSQKETMKLIIE